MFHSVFSNQYDRCQAEVNIPDELKKAELRCYDEAAPKFLLVQSQFSKPTVQCQRMSSEGNFT